MNPVKTATSTGDLAPPPGVSDEECGHLPYRYAPQPDGSTVFASVWELTSEERGRIAAGANIELEVWAFTHPPVSLAATDEKALIE